MQNCAPKYDNYCTTARSLTAGIGCRGGVRNSDFYQPHSINYWEVDGKHFSPDGEKPLSEGERDFLGNPKLYEVLKMTVEKERGAPKNTRMIQFSKSELHSPPPSMFETNSRTGSQYRRLPPDRPALLVDAKTINKPDF
jgi:hypothetical protein